MKANYHLRHVLDTRSGEALGPGQHRRHIRTMVCINVDSSHTANDLRATLIGIAESIAAFSGQGDAGAAVPGMRRQSYREAMVVLACDRVEDLAPDVKQFMVRLGHRPAPLGLAPALTGAAAALGALRFRALPHEARCRLHRRQGAPV